MSNGKIVDSGIDNFYRGRSIFITGATGFMGKVLVEKLLRSCPGIKNIYVLMRPKEENVDTKKRLEELVNTRIFEKLLKERPDALNKIVPITGDISLPNLDIDECDEDVLTETVSVVFHLAATVKFHEPIKSAVALNILATKRLVQLCRKMEKLEALIHVSTAYSNCDRKEIDEILYPPPADPEMIINFAESTDEEFLNRITPEIIKNRPTTYDFTKALAEHVFTKECAGLPAAIVRPSIVTAAWKEPLSGWIDNFNGLTGMLAGIGKGILRALLCNKHLITDLMPVDLAINLSIAVAWHTAISRPKNVIIYNCTSGDLNPIRWGEVGSYFQASATRFPFNNVYWYPGCSLINSRFIYKLLDICFSTVLAYLYDASLRAAGKTPKMVQVMNKLQKAASNLQFFATREWKFKCQNVMSLYEKLSEKDKVTFNFDVRQINWPKYMDNYAKGIRLFVLKEDPASIPSAKAHLWNSIKLIQQMGHLSVDSLIRNFKGWNEVVRYLREKERMYILQKMIQFLSIAMVWGLFKISKQAARKPYRNRPANWSEVCRDTMARFM